MNIFSSFNINEFVITILIVELVILFVLVAVLTIERFWFHFKKKREIRNKKIISHMLLECLEGKQGASPLSLQPFANQETLLSELEAFDRRFQGDAWETIEKTTSRPYLLPRARKYYNSFFWLRRNFAARCFALTPLPEDEEKILQLLDDPIFLVRDIAASAAIKLQSKQGVLKILHLMGSETGYGYYYYRDTLLNNGTVQIFNWIEEFASQIMDQKIHLTCLDLLAGKTMTISDDFLRKDLDSKDAGTRLAAIKVFAHNIQKDSADILLKYMDDSNAEIRAQASLGLAHFLSKDTLEKLEKALGDSSWIVREQAAWSLKKMGKAGLDILNKQIMEKNKNAYEAAQYALQFDW